MAKRYWLMKTEPDAYSIDDLKRDGSEHWDGIRNYQARNSMRDDMRVGDMVLFYHSVEKPVGVVGVAKICKEAYPDFTAFDPDSKYHDPKSKAESPTWMMVDVAFVEKWADTVSLEELKDDPNVDGMLVVKKGMRLSIQPVEKAHFDYVLKLGRGKGKVVKA